MKKFKLGFYPYFISISSIFISLIALVWSVYYLKDTVLIVLFAASFIFAIYNLVNIFFISSVTDNEGLTQRALVSKKHIPWKDINYVVEQPAGKLIKTSVGIYGNNKTINITNWTNNYKGLLRIIVDNSKNNSGIKVDPVVYEIIK